MPARSRPRFTARNADKYVLYTDAVQDAGSEIQFFKRVYRKANRRAPAVMREDFCGTAAICAEWVKRGKPNIAIGVDLDPGPLAWGRERYLSKLTPDQRQRVRLIQGNVLTARTGPVDGILALNFSFCVFKQRREIMKYLRRCRRDLRKGGVMVMDLYGGPESQKPNEDETAKDGYTYVWDQHAYNPITNEALNYIHFRFPDGSEMKRAFTYDWRLWTLRELEEGLREAGFSRAEVYWEGTDEDGEGNGRFTVRSKAESEDAWVAYIVGTA